MIRKIIYKKESSWNIWTSNYTPSRCRHSKSWDISYFYSWFQARVWIFQRSAIPLRRLILAHFSKIGIHYVGNSNFKISNQVIGQFFSLFLVVIFYQMFSMLGGCKFLYLYRRQLWWYLFKYYKSFCEKRLNREHLSILLFAILTELLLQF